MIEKNGIQDFPTGWYQATSSNKISHSKIHSFQVLAKSLICVRGRNRQVKIFDAHCPHLGAHLGVGGNIKNDIITCPFHGWQFNLTGACVQIPYCDKIPPRAILKSYPTNEKNQLIFIFYANKKEDYTVDLPLPESSFTPLFNWFLPMPYDQLVQQIKINFQDDGIHFISPGIMMFTTPKFKIIFTITPLDIHSCHFSTYAVGIKPWRFFQLGDLKKTISARCTSRGREKLPCSQ